MFTIDEDKNITYGGNGAGAQFDSQSKFMGVADALKLTRQDLEGIWNGFAGVAPFGSLKPTKKFKNRPYAVKQIWKAIQRLAGPEGEATPPVSKPVAKLRAKGTPKVKAPVVRVAGGDKESRIVASHQPGARSFAR